LAFSYWIDNLGFITEGRLAAVLIIPSLGVPNWSVIYIINTAPSVPMNLLWFVGLKVCKFSKWTAMRAIPRKILHWLQSYGYSLFSLKIGNAFS
jgi:hypothetical protein